MAKSLIHLSPNVHDVFHGLVGSLACMKSAASHRRLCLDDRRNNSELGIRHDEGGTVDPLQWVE